ncbi:outer membrane beta-barrel protein [Bradyrhizobium sp. BR13661]|uniref:outer membrane protein n=1 Tax=Bradyrhizobium sp. BR13661 TaxID=2940622 RepID=UPI0024736A05|nr:outer membrane beta-barrel protein [Bradyrhizobium sp. BR13661]
MLGVAFGAVAATNPAMAAEYPWTGSYVGGNIGYSWGNARGDVTAPGMTAFGLPASFPFSPKPDGVIGGGQIGYNWQANNRWVFGVEADLQGSAEKAHSSRSDPFSFVPGGEGATTVAGALNQSIDAKILWFGTLRGRVGALLQPSLLLYATAGVAYGETKVSGSGTAAGGLTGLSYAFNGSKVNVGWTAGAGLEGMLPNCKGWTWKLEYLYVDLGSQSGTGTDAVFATVYSWNAKFTDNIVRVGVNYHLP